MKLTHLRQQSMQDFYSVTGTTTKKPRHLGRAELKTCDNDIYRYPHEKGYTLLHGFGILMKNSSLELYLSHCLISTRLKVSSKTVINPTDYISAHNISTRRYGINVIKFDRMGALFAVGGSDGIIRVYDFDECLALLQGTGSNPYADPVVVQDLQRSIADIAWSPANPDAIVVSYSYVSGIHLIDLNDPTRAAPIEVGREGISGGHKCLLFLSDAESSPNTKEKVTHKNVS
jgi:WD40 repeat protein